MNSVNRVTLVTALRKLRYAKEFKSGIWPIPRLVSTRLSPLRALIDLTPQAIAPDAERRAAMIVARDADYGTQNTYQKSR